VAVSDELNESGEWKMLANPRFCWAMAITRVVPSTIRTMAKAMAE
jgi:hypothetical protein